MNNRFLFFGSIFTVYNFLFYCSIYAGDNAQQTSMYRCVEKGIVREGRTLFNGTNGIDNVGSYLLSTSCDGHVLSCFSGSSGGEYNPMSLLDLEARIDKSYAIVDELKGSPVSAIHLLDPTTFAVGHGKTIHIFEDQNTISKTHADFSETLLALTRQLSPQLLSEQDSIAKIGHYKKHLVGISQEGCISTWVNCDPQQRQDLDCKNKFFSSVIDSVQGMIYLGLDDGKIFIAKIDNLKDNRIIPLFFEAKKINEISLAGNQLLACALCECNTICCRRDFFKYVAKNPCRYRAAGAGWWQDCRATDLCEHKSKKLASLSRSCNCHPSIASAVFQKSAMMKYIFSVPKLPKDLQREIINFLVSEHDEHITQCDNKYILMTTDQFKNSESMQALSKELAITTDQCPKKAYLLPSGNIFLHTRQCSKNVSSERIEEYVIVVNPETPSIPQKAYAVKTSRTEVLFGDVYHEYPIHIVPSGDLIYILGETNGIGCTNQQLAHITALIPNEVRHLMNELNRRVKILIKHPRLIRRKLWDNKYKIIGAGLLGYALYKVYNWLDQESIEKTTK
jgi:hypothetical protein